LSAFDLFAAVPIRVVAFQPSVANQASGFLTVWAFDKLKGCQELFAVFVIAEEPGDAQSLRR
jgi:hypothetical protein